MNEALLQSIWKYRLLQTNCFKGTKNEDIEILSIGEHNNDSGPDFFNSKAKINHITLAGNVELHLKTSDWIKHNHQNNRNYDNLILHVVYEHDTEINQNEKHNVSVIELKELIKPSLIKQYQTIINSKSKILCDKSINTTPSLIWKSWLDRLAVNRLEEKTHYIESLYLYANQSYEDLLYILLCRNFGFKINNEPFELLGKSLPYSIIKKYTNQPVLVEALLFGTGGFLDEPYEDDFPKLLQNEFEFLKHKYQLTVLKKELWKFSKTRPVNFPTIRISQLTHLFCKQESLYHFIERKPNLEELKKWFDAQASAYWQTHFIFDIETEFSTKTLGKTAFESILINTVVPFLFFITKKQISSNYIDYTLELLSQLPPEENIKTKAFKHLRMEPQNALESQAQIQLYDKFCSTKGCLNCRVGEHLLKSST